MSGSYLNHRIPLCYTSPVEKVVCRQPRPPRSAMQRKRIVLVSLMAATLAAIAAGAATASSLRQQAVTLNLVAYSTPRPVLDKLISEFKKTPQGADINIRGSYGPSSAQGQAVANGLPADGVILNTGNDINDLVDKGLINKN